MVVRARWRLIIGAWAVVWSSSQLQFFHAQAFANQFDPMGVVDETIQNRVGVSGIRDNFVPTVHGELGRDNGRAAAVSFFEDFQEVAFGGLPKLAMRRLGGIAGADESKAPAATPVESRLKPGARLARSRCLS